MHVVTNKKYVDESSDVIEYNKKRKDFESMSIICGKEKGAPSKKLFIICNEIYEHIKTHNPLVLAGYGCWLTEKHVIRVLAKFSMPNLDLVLYHRKNI